MICNHNFILSGKRGYEKCVDCGTYHSIASKSPDDLYVNNPYWGDGSGRSTLEQQIENLTCTDECGISKVDRVLQFVPKRGKVVLEIGCSPGILMDKLLDLNYDVYGIEPSIEYVPVLIEKAKGAKIFNGYFPDVTRECPNNTFDCIIAMDVVEHIEDYEMVFYEVKRLLKEGGTAIIMSPIIYEDGFIREGEFIPEEHIWLFSKKFLEPYLKERFSEVKFSRWIVSHEIIILKK